MIILCVAVVFTSGCEEDGTGIAVTGVSLDKNILELYEGTEETLIATIAPADATDPTIVWNSSNPAVATVDNKGKVVALTVGTTTITAASGSQDATCEVTVKANAYSKLIGEWTFHALDAAKEEREVNFDVSISDGGKEGDVEQYFVFSGFKDGAGYTASIPWTVRFNKAENTLSLLQGSTYKKYNFGFVAEVRICPMNMDAELLTELEGTWNETFDKIEFDENGIISTAVFDTTTGDYRGYWGGAYCNCSLIKKK